MKRCINVVLVLAALMLAAGWAAAPAAGQLSNPAPGWEPGQPFLVTIHDPRGTPMMVVHAGRIPLASDPRARLVLPDLGNSGLVYVVSTRGDPGGRRPPVRFPNDVLKKEQEIVGRIHSVVLLSPANPALGMGARHILIVGANSLDHGLLPESFDPDTGAASGLAGCTFGGYLVPGMGILKSADDVLNLAPTMPRRSMDGDRAYGAPQETPPDGIPPDELYGGDRRVMRPITPIDGFPHAGRLAPGQGDDLLTGGGGGVTGIDPGGAGPPEAAAAADCTFGGYQAPGAGVLGGKDVVMGLDPGAARRSMDPGARPQGDLWNVPDRPAPDPHALRPTRWVPIPSPRWWKNPGAGSLGQGNFILGLSDKGMTLDMQGK